MIDRAKEDAQSAVVEIWEGKDLLDHFEWFDDDSVVGRPVDYLDRVAQMIQRQGVDY